MRIIFDTYAWVEYFLGTEKGKKVSQILVESNELYTPSIVLLELSYKSIKEGWNYDSLFQFIKTKTAIIDLDEEVISKTGLVYWELRKQGKNASLVDATLLTTARILKAKIITGDQHFKDTDESIMI